MTDETSYISFNYPAGQYEQFSPGAFDRTVGDEFPVRDERDGSSVNGTLDSAKVAPDGRSVELVVAVPSEWLDGRLGDESNHWSIV